MSKRKKNRSRKSGQKVHQKKVKREQAKQTQAAVDEVRADIVDIPSILGGEFDYGANDIEALRTKIEALPKPKIPLKILFISEASYLHTGFSTYMREVLKRLHQKKYFEVFEFGSYGHGVKQEPRARDIPWKYYHNMPENFIEQYEYGDPHGDGGAQQRYSENQFGKWKLSYVLADCRPDFVLMLRDNWMDTHVIKNDLIGNCKTYWMACVDGYPQKWQWLGDYFQVDKLFAYSHFGKKVLERQSVCTVAKLKQVKPLQVQNVHQPGVNIDVFKPFPKSEVKKTFGINPKWRFVGTVMRNQPRKLFPRIIEAFKKLKQKHPIESENVHLLLHTSVPDVGWPIPELVTQNGLDDFVYYTYHCLQCHNIAISKFIGPANPQGPFPNCPVCGAQGTFRTPSTQFGVSEQQLNLILNLMDVYIQGSIAEGDGMPINEAKAAGIPVLASDYSAMYEKNRNGGAMPIENETIYLERETGQWRSLFDRNDLVKKLALLLGDDLRRNKMSKEARECAAKYYNWDLCALKWEHELLSDTPKDRAEHWDKPVDIRPLPKEHPPMELDNKEWIEWCYENILGRSGVDAGGMRTWTADLEASDRANKRVEGRQRLEKFFRDMIEKENASKAIRQDPKLALVNPVERIRDKIVDKNKFNILYCMKETAGDVFISTGIIDGLHAKYPDAHIYFATQPQYFDLVKSHPHIKDVFEYHPTMANYRTHESFAMYEGPFNMVFHPAIITQHIPHWIHGGYGEWLGRCYADMCHVKFGDFYIKCDEELAQDLPLEYITFQSQTRQDPKDFDHMDEVLKKIKNHPLVHIGALEDKALEIPGANIIDLRGKTNFEQLAGVLKNAKCHVGQDSLPMHIASALQTPAVIVFGGTYAKQGCAPHYKNLVTIETQNRGPCVTSCHLAQCEAKKSGFDKCINNIDVDEVVVAIGKIIGEENVVPPEPLKLSAYMIIKDGIKYEFPFEESIKAAAAICDEVVIVDGGSTDGTWEKLTELASPVFECVNKENDYHVVANGHQPIRIFEHPWDLNNPTLFGDEKTYARKQCTGTWLIQLDADEILHEPKRGMIKEMIAKNKQVELMDFPCINFYGNKKTIRIEPNCWKWRLSHNDARIVHGVHGAARDFDPDTMQITMDKKKSDGCEYIYADNLEILQHKVTFDPALVMAHEALKAGKCGTERYLEVLTHIVKNFACVFHYSWLDLERKKQNGGFWDETYHGKKNATHNTTKDITGRIEAGKDLLIEFDLEAVLNDPERVQV
jgi:ADP-heptose:LPS heptosyltransferase/glycosyltransferase involved in cell wall biosynthesis